MCLLGRSEWICEAHVFSYLMYGLMYGEVGIKSTELMDCEAHVFSYLMYRKLG